MTVPNGAANNKAPREIGGICFVGGAGYPFPLDESTRKKFRTLSPLGPLFVIGFSSGAARRFHDQARFYLLRRFRWPFLRYVAMAWAGPVIAWWLVMRHGVKVLVAQSPYEGAAAALAKIAAAAFGRRSRLVVESHGDFEQALFLQRKVRPIRLYRSIMRVASCFALRQADALRSISEATARQLARLHPEKPQVRFPTWTDVDLFKKAAAESRHRDDIILFVGVLTPLKGVHFLLEAFEKMAAEFPGWRVRIVGEVLDPGYFSELRRHSQCPSLRGRIEFAGALARTQVAKTMSRSKVLVLPSKSEGLGRVIVEGMVAGLAVVASKVGGIVDLVEDGTNGLLVPVADVGALEKSLRGLLEDPERIGALAQAGIRCGAAAFESAAYLEGYRRVIELACRQVQHEDGN